MNERLDSLARWLGARRDRRRVATAAAGGALGLLGVSAYREVAGAKSCKNNKDCPDGKKCKNKKKQNNGKRKGRCK